MRMIGSICIAVILGALDIYPVDFANNAFSAKGFFIVTGFLILWNVVYDSFKKS
jgi:hypothetical protein